MGKHKSIAIQPGYILLQSLIIFSPSYQIRKYLLYFASLNENLSTLTPVNRFQKAKQLTLNLPHKRAGTIDKSDL